MTNPVQFCLEALLAGIGDSIDDLKASNPRQYNFIVNKLLLRAYDEHDPANQVIDRDYFHYDVHWSLYKERMNIVEGRKLGLLKDMSGDELKKTFPSLGFPAAPAPQTAPEDPHKPLAGHRLQALCRAS